jgi:hypothetical protein
MDDELRATLKQLLKDHMNVTIELDQTGFAKLTVCVLFEGEEIDSDTVYLDDMIDERIRKQIDQI